MSDGAAHSLRLWVNGRELALRAGSTVADLVRARDLVPEQVAVEVNRSLVPRARHAEVLLCDGDRVELVTLVGGG